MKPLFYFQMTLEGYINCKVCNKPFKEKSILIHIGLIKNCKANYPAKDLEKLTSESNMRKLNQIKEIKRKTYNPQKKSSENKAYYVQNKASVRSKQHEHYESKKNLAKFYEECQYGPIFPCICCKRCLPKRGVKIFQEQFYHVLVENKIDGNVDISKCLMIDGNFHICHSCYSNLSKKKMPNLCFKNGLQLAPVPACLQISSLGNQLLAKHLIFIKIRPLPKTGMGKMNDRVSYQ